MFTLNTSIGIIGNYARDPDIRHPIPSSHNLNTPSLIVLDSFEDPI